MAKHDEHDVALSLGVDGRLFLSQPAPDEFGSLEPKLGRQLQTALAQSQAAGLTRLTSSEWGESLPATLAYWRNWVRTFFRAVCNATEEPGESWRELPAPDDAALAELIAAAPPMLGLEYLDAACLKSLWRELCEYAADQASDDDDGALAWLRRVNPQAHLVGKVTFHLAENKRDPDRPFAFLATFAHRLSSTAKPQHRPLAEALRESIELRDTAQLDRLLEPVRRAAERSDFAAEMLRTRKLFAPQALTPEEAYRFLRQASELEAAGVVVRLPNWWSPQRPMRPRVSVRLGEKRPSRVGFDSLVDFQVGLEIDGETLTEEEIRRLLSESPGLKLFKGKWVEVDQRQLKQALDHWKSLRREHVDGVDLVTGMRMLAGISFDSPEQSSEPLAEWSRVIAGDWLQSTLARMRSPDTSSVCQPGRDLQATLRPYQVDGVRWLWFMTELGLGGCLADDMGLGKTIQVLDLLLQRKRVAADRQEQAADDFQPASQSRGRQKTRKHSAANSPATTAENSSGDAPHGPSESGSEHAGATPTLLVAPASLLGNWRQEAAKFAPSLRVFIAHRSECDADELARRASDPATGFADIDLVITSYSMVRRHAWLDKLRWSLIVLDEAQAIKNAGAEQTKALKKLPSDRRLVMTGTPIENDVGELWSLFDFASPGLLGNATQFKRYVANLSRQKDGQAYAGLRQLVRPYILRRQKSDPSIAPDLPEKIEMRVECGLSKTQTVLYAQAVARLKDTLKATDDMQRRGAVLAALMQFKQICNHPAQARGDEQYSPEESGKFQRLRQLCEPIVARQEKMLVFTQFQSLCEPLADFLATVFHADGLVLHGGTPVKRRSELVREFQQDARRPFFVISLKAGGSGLNLTAASHVVHFDRWWNPAVENQATDRAFRIGQKRNVLVHKFVCRGTIEERIDAMIAEKRQVAEQVLDADGAPKLTELSDDELLKFVALDLSRATES